MYKVCPNCRKDISSEDEDIVEMYFSGCPFCGAYIISKNMASAAIDRKTVTPKKFFGPHFTEEQEKRFAKIEERAEKIRREMEDRY